PVYPATLVINETKKEVVTNKSGYYKLVLNPGVYTLSVSSLGSYSKNFNLSVTANGTHNIFLETKPIALDEVIISSNQNENVKDLKMGFEKIDIKNIKNLPSILGEKDVIKVALLLPGVQTVGELSSGFNVRGSPADQNIFYLNNLPVYNPSHVFGLFTSFNSDAIKEFRFYKSNIPIEYGGHLSSIFEIDTKTGNKKHFSSRGGIGLTSGQMLIEGPFQKEKSSYLISVRSSYSDWILGLVKNLDIKNSSISFYDGLMNFSFNLDNKNNLDFFLYGSNDNSDLTFGINNKYSNLGATLNWTHIFNKKLKSEFNLIKSYYSYYEENNEIENIGFKHSFDLNHNEFKLKFKYNLNSLNMIYFGLNTKYYKLNFGEYLPANEFSHVKPINFESEQAISNSVFLGDKLDLFTNFSLEGAVRVTNYSYLGPKTVYLYEKNEPRIIKNINDSVKYNKNDIISNNLDFDFRFSTKYELNRTSSIKFSFNRLHQYIFMLSNTVTISPVNNWKLSDSNLKPMIGDQYSLGLYKNITRNKIETSVEIYYKDVQNLVEYKDGANFNANKVPESNIIQGTLNAYGIELMIKKKTGKLNGWVNYTYSKSEVLAMDINTGEMNNFGLKYAANYDRPNTANLVLNYRISKRFSISSNVVYATGRPITYPTSIYYIHDIQIVDFSKRNEYRIPDYFRIDLAFNFEGNLKKNKFAHSSWTIGFYNLTSRRNPYSVIFRNSNGIIKGYSVSILGSVIPSITYNLKLGNYED
ncbi:MAG: TonB-dependent receptor, partial [Chlorobi bacterium]|nr:TonB-dependent receptor [Chlorobiota bacterium]